jgi:hypothetical protein
MTTTPQQVLSDDEIDRAQGEAYLALSNTGFTGGMGGETWDRASARAIEAAVLAKIQAAPQAVPPLWEAFHSMQASQSTVDPEIAQATAKGFYAMLEDGTQAQPISQHCIELRSEPGCRYSGLCIHCAQQPAQGVGEVASKSEFCWLVENFLGDGTGNSTGQYHTGFTDLSGGSRSTTDPMQAKRYSTWKQANTASVKLGHTLSGTWRAVQHGFAVHPAPSAAVVDTKLAIYERLIPIISNCIKHQQVNSAGELIAQLDKELAALTAQHAQTSEKQS